MVAQNLSAEDYAVATLRKVAQQKQFSGGEFAGVAGAPDTVIVPPAATLYAFCRDRFSGDH